ncbi:polyribonucleotide nucleotidyltransferase [Segatella copri]|jgi:polyribonucleotide nucleotidyltransferase|uniref:Polyribonucleotide nucleotidyltransferase n=2 Tax=Segatella copri TaxID=165179 RepID=A0A6I2TYA6_9BACT|nr:polyribonucleotide nucleotidyltransferase [Segatella copri]EFB33960.1 polyribonucleotide nucleotidyltransferase [Segatella copri DSM 18205]MBW0030434.1 polyribonucleotide nucleotidyltransferase [Segatella copri]MCF2609021.1 polyribonucleotide nucleotidyltransferase [Segatella copri]MCW4097204.1 polyribonucleotide nucleotidyltransferase [Segatella copri]MDD6740682.1 polyribonucleotide nucleotidyltransferase [Segatella copri]
MNVITKSVQLPDGRTITIETGKVAKQADGAAVLRMGNTVLLATVCAAKDAVPGTDFMPLQVDYREQYSAAGRFPGGFTKREGKASDEEILTSRLVDRALRPLFPSNYHAEVYVQVMLLSADGVDQPDALAGFAASAAMACSDIPFEYYISEVRVARINGEYVVNPTFQQMEEADMDIMVGATKDNIMMVEGEMKEVSEQDLIGALKVAAEAIKPMCELQYELAKEKGTDVKREYDHEINDEELREQIKSELYKPAYDINHQALEKHARQDAFDKVLADFLEKYDAAHTDLSEEDLEEKHAEATRYYDDVMRDAMRRCILDEGLRLDGRATTDIRPIWCEVSPLPMPHGSAIFQRGETMSLSTCTLGTKMDEKLIDGVLEKSYQRFLLHYNFPPFSTGEAKAQRGVGRREIGHGHLAWRGLKGQIPTDFPYTVRLVSQILESNGSSSMATVCAGTLALMDAGVPMKKPVSGIAMGLIKNPGEDKYAILSDILGDEDHLGDMDFKTTGTRDGLTATQMDIKCDGLSFEILEEALMQAKAGREHILNCMMETISEPRAEMKPQVPRIVAFDIPKEFIGAVIGPGGKIIQQMQEDTGATITIEETDGQGHVQVSAPNKDSIDAALAKIKAIVAVPEVGEVYEGTVRSIMPYGCFVEILPGKDGLLHISEIDWKRLETVEEAGIKEGDKIKVKLMEIDPKTGKYKLSHRVLMEKPEGYVERERRPRPERGERRGRRDDRHEGRGERPARQPRRYEHRNDEQAPKEFNDSLDHNNDVE